MSLAYDRALLPLHQSSHQAPERMRRTSSGSDLAGSSILAAPTPYVYIPPSTAGAERLLSAVDFRGHCNGGTISHLPLMRGGAIRLPACAAEVQGGFLTAFSLHTVDHGDLLFNLPLGSISSVRVHHSSPSVLQRFSCCCRTQEVLALDVDAPSGWLRWGPTGMAGLLRVSLHVDEYAAPCNRAVAA